MRPLNSDALQPVPFVPFNPRAEVRVTRRHLPHWRQDGATYFVTFRLADSIPRAVAARWAEEREIWCRQFGLHAGLSPAAWAERWRTIPREDREAFERSQARQLLVELDRCHGVCVLRDSRVSEVVVESLLRTGAGEGRRAGCGDFVVMPNHVHWLVRPDDGADLDEILPAVKRFTATRINRVLGRNGHLWQRESFDRIVRDREELERTIAYIAENPAKAGLGGGACRHFQARWVFP